jgi:hypothetical protein
MGDIDGISYGAFIIPGLHAYYTSRRNSSRALKIVIDALRGGAGIAEPSA